MVQWLLSNQFYMASYTILEDLENGRCRVLFTADNGYNEVQEYVNDKNILSNAAQHFDAEQKRLDAGNKEVMENVKLTPVEVSENLNA